MTDLVQRLWNEAPISLEEELIIEAAERIEMLEAAIRQWRDTDGDQRTRIGIMAREHEEQTHRIESLEARVAQQVKLFYAAGEDAARLHERIEELEAALREIAAPRAFNFTELHWMQAIARRALEGSHE